MSSFNPSLWQYCATVSFKDRCVWLMSLSLSHCKYHVKSERVCFILVVPNMVCLGHNSYSVNAFGFISEEMEGESLGQKQLGQLSIKIRTIRGVGNTSYFAAESQTDICANSSPNIVTTWGMELCDFSHVPHEDMYRHMCLLLRVP